MINENLPSGLLYVLREKTLALRDLLGLNLKRSKFIIDPGPRMLAESAGIKDVSFIPLLILRE